MKNKTVKMVLAVVVLGVCLQDADKRKGIVSGI